MQASRLQDNVENFIVSCGVEQLLPVMLARRAAGYLADFRESRLSFQIGTSLHVITQMSFPPFQVAMEQEIYQSRQTIVD